MLNLCQAIGVIVFSTDIVEILRLGRYNETAVQQPPVRVTFELICMRDNLLKKKSTLVSKAKFASIYINPDEPLDVRRMKGMFRQIAYLARRDGLDVTFRSDWIQIGETVYMSTEIAKIPDKYRPPISSRPTKRDISRSRNKKENERSDQAIAPEIVGADNMDEHSEIQDQLPRDKMELRQSPEPNEKIKLTKCGLTFSGPTAYLSNLHRCDFVFEGRPYTSPEQSFQYENAKSRNQIAGIG